MKFLPRERFFQAPHRNPAPAITIVFNLIIKIGSSFSDREAVFFCTIKRFSKTKTDFAFRFPSRRKLLKCIYFSIPQVFVKEKGKKKVDSSPFAAYVGENAHFAHVQ